MERQIVTFDLRTTEELGELINEYLKLRSEKLRKAAEETSAADIEEEVDAAKTEYPWAINIGRTVLIKAWLCHSLARILKRPGWRKIINLEYCRNGGKVVNKTNSLRQPLAFGRSSR